MHLFMNKRPSVYTHNIINSVIIIVLMLNTRSQKKLTQNYLTET